MYKTANFMQFLGALMTARVRERKRLFLVFAISSRLLYIPLAFVPLLFPSLRANTTSGSHQAVP